MCQQCRLRQEILSLNFFPIVITFMIPWSINNFCNQKGKKWTAAGSMENGHLKSTVHPDPWSDATEGYGPGLQCAEERCVFKRTIAMSHPTEPQPSRLSIGGRGWEVIPNSQACTYSLLFLIETGPSETPADLRVRTSVQKLQLWKESPECYERPGKSMLLIQGQVLRCCLWNERDWTLADVSDLWNNVYF